MLHDNVKFNANTEDKYWSNDPQVDKSFSWYGPYCFEALLQYTLPTMEKLTGKRLYPAYSYARIYYNGATMARHKDRPSCQYSATVTIEVDDSGPWEIGMQNYAGEEKMLSLPVGTMVAYRGDQLDHWREEPYNGNKQIQAFLHYVDADSEYSNLKYDQRVMLGAMKQLDQDEQLELFQKGF